MKRSTLFHFGSTIIIFLLFSLLSNAQQREISGIIQNVNNLPLEGATVSVKNHSTSTITGSDGRFTLLVPDNAVLEVSYVGYLTQEIIVGNQTALTIQMQVSGLGLEEIVVTGYSSQRKKDIIGAVSIVNTNDLKKTPSSNLVAQLQGRVAGVTVSSTGDPGSSAVVRIRGFASYGNNSPLYVIDGVPSTDVSSLNPEDIESMQILKDATSASIYGARAANGVIIITTKHGKANSRSVSYNSYVGYQSIPYNRIPKTLNTQELVDYLSLKYDDNYIDPVFGKHGDFSIPDMYIVSNSFKGGVSSNDPRANPDLYTISDYANIYQILKTSPGTDWFRAMSQKGLIQSHELSASGGNDNSTYSLGLNYYDNDGTFKYTGYNRYSVRMNSTFKVSNFLTIGQNAQVSYDERKGNATVISENSAWGYAFRSSPFIPVYDIKGGWGGSLIGGTAFGANPVALLYRQRDRTNKSLRAFGNVFAEINIAKGITGRTSFGINAANGMIKSPSRKQYEQSQRQTYTQLTESSSSLLNWTWTNTLSFKRVINDQNINILIGTEAIKNSERGLSASKRSYDFETSDFLTLNNGLPQTLGDITATNPVIVNNTMFSYFGKVDYTYKQRYLVTGTLRRDGSSVFGSEVRFGNFPSVGLGWIVTQEDFMRSLKWVDELKLRAGWGQMGSISNVPGNNQYSTFSSNVGDNFYDVSAVNSSTTQGYGLSSEGNKKTKWETTETMNIGLDALLFDSRLSVSIDVYQKDTRDLLVPSLRNGLELLVTKPLINLGTMRNRGVDIQLGTNGKITGDLTYDASLTFTHYKNELTKLNDQNTPLILKAGRLNNVLLTTSGESVSSFYGYMIDGFYNSSEDVSKGNKINGSLGQVGSWKFKDINGDRNITPADRTILGSPHPDFQMGLNLGVKYKNFDLNTFLFWNQGSEIFNYTKYFTYMGVLNGGVAYGKLYDAWTPSTFASAKTPQLGVGTQNGYTSFVTGNPNSFYVEDGSYFRLKTLQLGYTFPQKLMSKAKINNLRVYLQAQNLFLITNYTGADPDLGLISGIGSDQSLGVDYSGYPHLKGFLIGFNLSL